MDKKSLSRDIKIGISTGEYKVSVDTTNLFNDFFFIVNHKRKIIKFLFEIGAVLTGSRALDCYRINNKRIFNRKPKDWDFILTKKQFFKLCDKYKIYDFDIDRSSYFLNKSFATFSDGYGVDSYLFPCLIQIIIKDDEGYEELKYFNGRRNNMRFSKLENIINSKISLSDKPINLKESFISYKRLESSKKHINDINNLIVNINSL